MVRTVPTAFRMHFEHVPATISADAFFAASLQSAEVGLEVELEVPLEEPPPPPPRLL